jgi:hypothetical protein
LIRVCDLSPGCPAPPVAFPSAGVDARTGVEGDPRPTERRTACENVANDTVCDPLPPLLDSPEPGLRAWKKAKALRARLSVAPAVVASERIGSPIVIQRTATSGSANSTGRARVRERAMVRAEGSRRGSST